MSDDDHTDMTHSEWLRRVTAMARYWKSEIAKLGALRLLEKHVTGDDLDAFLARVAQGEADARG